MKTSPKQLVMALLTGVLCVGCAHYANVDTVEEPCWSGGDTFVSSHQLPDGRSHVVVERVRAADGACDDHWQENLIYDRGGRLEARTLDLVRCGVIEQRWDASYDARAGNWTVERTLDLDRDGEHDRAASYAVSSPGPAGQNFGSAASCPVMAHLPIDQPPSLALAALGR